MARSVARDLQSHWCAGWLEIPRAFFQSLARFCSFMLRTMGSWQKGSAIQTGELGLASLTSKNFAWGLACP
jgi:hypothetical protein